MRYHWTAFLLVLLTLFAQVAVAQTISEDRVIGNWKGSTGGRNLELQLSSRGSAVTKVDRENFTGTWKLDGANRVIVDTGRNGRGFAFVFRLVDDNLVATTWDKNYFGSRQLRLRRDGNSDNGRDRWDDRNFEGTYYWPRAGADSEQVVTLELTSRNRATMTLESARRGFRPQVTRGTWEMGRDGKIQMDMSGSRGSDRWIFRTSSNNRLIATSWDRNDWGRDTPEFSKGRKPDIQPVDQAEGIWTWRPAGRGRITMTLSPRGRLDWSQDLDRGGRETAEGTWSWEGNEIRVKVNKRRDTLTFRFRVDRDRLTADQWDRDEWGGGRPEFRRD